MSRLAWQDFGRREASDAARAAKPDVFDRLLRGTARLVIRRPAAIVSAFVLIIVVSALGYARLEIDTNVVEMFTERTEIRRSIEVLSRRTKT